MAKCKSTEFPSQSKWKKDRVSSASPHSLWNTEVLNTRYNYTILFDRLEKKHNIIFILSLYDCLRDTNVWKTKENHQNKMSQYLTWRYETMIWFGLSHLNTMIAITFISQDLIIYWINQKYNMIKTFHK